MPTLTAKQLTKLAPYPRLNYIIKLPGTIHADVELEPGTKNKEYSIPMGFKWGLFTAFDGKYSIENANSIATAAMAATSWIFDNQDTKNRLWFVDLGGKIMTSGISFPDQATVQPEEEQDMCKFKLFEIYKAPAWETTIFVNAKDNPYLQEGSKMSGGGAGFYTPLKQANKPKFSAWQSALYSEIRFYCISDIFERIASAYEIDPYDESIRPLFANFQELPLGFDVENLRFALK